MSSTVSLSSSYQIKDLGGRLREAQPEKFALKFKGSGGPSIGVVYTFNQSPKKTSGKKMKKYIHEIKIDLRCGRLGKPTISQQQKPSLNDIEQLAGKLCE